MPSRWLQLVHGTTAPVLLAECHHRKSASEATALRRYTNQIIIIIIIIKMASTAAYNL